MDGMMSSVMISMMVSVMVTVAMVVTMMMAVLVMRGTPLRRDYTGVVAALGQLQSWERALATLPEMRARSGQGGVRQQIGTAVLYYAMI